LERENSTCAALGAPPDGRKSGTPFGENQSPSYGADKKGITALLKSLGKLPFDRTATGGLNLTFSKKVSADILQALVISYFQLGGLHVGISVIDREMLLDAMERPERYKSLTVRLYGFSEYFVSLPEWQQIAILNRTEYSV
jgi:formate C-acetyltransferase